MALEVSAFHFEMLPRTISLQISLYKHYRACQHIDAAFVS